MSQPLAPGQYAEAAELLARAFFDYPAHLYLLPRAERRLEASRWLFGCILRLNRGFGTSFGYSAPGMPGLVGVALWVPPGGRASAWDLLRAGLLQAPLRMGPGAVRRMLHAMDVVERVKREVMRGRAHWYLDYLGVAPDHQGRGHGRRILAEHLRAPSPRANLPCLLLTSRESNLAFYRGSGFEVARSDLIDERSGYRIWSMVREPVTP